MRNKDCVGTVKVRKSGYDGEIVSVEWVREDGNCSVDCDAPIYGTWFIGHKLIWKFSRYLYNNGLLLDVILSQNSVDPILFVNKAKIQTFRSVKEEHIDGIVELRDMCYSNGLSSLSPGLWFKAPECIGMNASDLVTQGPICIVRRGWIKDVCEIDQVEAYLQSMIVVQNSFHEWRYCTVEVDKSLDFGVVPYRMNNAIAYPVGRFKGWIKVGSRLEQFYKVIEEHNSICGYIGDMSDTIERMQSLPKRLRKIAYTRLWGTSCTNFYYKMNEDGEVSLIGAPFNFDTVQKGKDRTLFAAAVAWDSMERTIMAIQSLGSLFVGAHIDCIWYESDMGFGEKRMQTYGNWAEKARGDMFIRGIGAYTITDGSGNIVKRGDMNCSESAQEIESTVEWHGDRGIPICMDNK